MHKFEKEFLKGQYKNRSWVAQMIDSIKPIDEVKPLDDILGLKLPNNKSYTLKEIYISEAENIADATIKYLSAIPTKK